MASLDSTSRAIVSLLMFSRISAFLCLLSTSALTVNESLSHTDSTDAIPLVCQLLRGQATREISAAGLSSLPI